MAVQLAISYQTLVELIEQLPPEEQQDLLLRLQGHAKRRALTGDEWKALFDSIKISTPVGDSFSLRREDWYDDDQ
jgi:hypothetical protein